MKRILGSGYEGLQLESARVVQLMDEMDVAVMMLDRETGVFRYVNTRVGEDIGKSKGEIIGRHYKQIFWPEFISVYDRMVELCMDGQAHSTIYYWAEMAQWEQISAKTVIWDYTPCVMLTITYVSEIARTNFMVESVVYFDSLLGLPNGAKLEVDLNDLAEVETPVLLYISISELQEINHLYGWQNGDLLLTQIRDWLMLSESRRAQLYRLGNGFAIFGRGVSVEDAKSRAEEIADRFQQPWYLPLGGNTISMYCAVKLGIIHGTHVKNEMQNLLMRTINLPDQGRRYVIYDQRADLQAKDLMMFRHLLINSIHNNMQGFSVNYQPVVDIKSEQWIGLEALCRFKTPDGREISPLVFIRQAEQLGLIEKIDTWVRETAMRQCVSLGLDRCRLELGINFSPSQRLDESFVESLHQAVLNTGFPIDRLNLEVTEHTKMDFSEQNLRILHEIADMGVGLSIDDFGVGYSSLENVIKIPADVLKLDKLLIDGITEDGGKLYLLEGIANIATRLGLQTIAEGVETQMQLNILRDFNVDFAQGFHFSRPLTYEQLVKNKHRFY